MSDRKTTIENYVREFMVQPIAKKLPNRGILAGGALSNWIIHRVKNTQTPIINDLDVFTIDSFTDKHTWTTSLTSWDPIMVKNGYHHMMRLRFDKWYKILECKREGLVNYISVETQTGLGYMTILENFDLNLCAVGYCLETKEVLYTSEFLDFFDSLYTSPVFSIQNINSPDKTLIRALKKSSQLGIDFNPNDLEFLIYLVREVPRFGRKTFTDKLAEDFYFLCNDPKFAPLVNELRIVRREDIEEYLRSKSSKYIGEDHFKLWSLEENPNIVAPSPSLKIQTRFFRTCIHSLNLYKIMDRNIESFKEHQDNFLENLDFLALTGWCDMSWDKIQENSLWIWWISNLTIYSPKSFNFFRKLGMTKSVEFIQKFHSTPGWDNMGKFFDSCPFSLIEDYVDGKDPDGLLEAYLEIMSRKSNVPPVSTWTPEKPNN